LSFEVGVESGVRHQIEQHRPDPLPFGSPAMLRLRSERATGRPDPVP